METETIIQYAIDEGFSAAEIIDTAQIDFEPAFRVCCEENLCGQYGVNYTCPPDCGSPEEMRQRILSHKKALVLQTIWEIRDYSDKDAIKQAKGRHNASALRLMKRLRDGNCPGFLVGASGCSLCSPCGLKKGEPCRFPENRYSCMSAYCIFVKKLADKCGIEYDCGDGLLAFFGLYVFD